MTSIGGHFWTKTCILIGVCIYFGTLNTHLPNSQWAASNGLYRQSMTSWPFTDLDWRSFLDKNLHLHKCVYFILQHTLVIFSDNSPTHTNTHYAKIHTLDLLWSSRAENDLQWPWRPIRDIIHDLLYQKLCFLHCIISANGHHQPLTASTQHNDLDWRSFLNKNLHLHKCVYFSIL